MYSLPSTSVMCAPAAWAITSGTGRCVARGDDDTPRGSTSAARARYATERAWREVEAGTGEVVDEGSGEELESRFMWKDG